MNKGGYNPKPMWNGNYKRNKILRKECKHMEENIYRKKYPIPVNTNPHKGELYH